MKKIEALFVEEKLGEVRDAIFKHGIHRFVVSNTVVHEFEHHAGSRWRSSETTDDESVTIKLEVVVADEISGPVARAILATARTRHPTPSVTISPVDEVLEVTFAKKQAGGVVRDAGASGRPEAKGQAGSEVQHSGTSERPEAKGQTGGEVRNSGSGGRPDGKGRVGS
jgi:nitrogen regulatory protein PII